MDENTESKRDDVAEEVADSFDDAEITLAETQNDDMHDDMYDDVRDDVCGDEENDEEYVEYGGAFFDALSKLKSVLKRVFNKKVVALILAIVLVAQTVVAIVLSESVLNPNKFISSEKAEIITQGNLSDDVYRNWLSEKSVDRYIQNSENSKLHAAEVENYSTSHSYAIICHTMISDATDMAVYAYHFYDLGFSVVLPDARGYGQSEYKKINMGWYDRYDVVSWVNYIVEKDADARIFLFGVGMGGSTVLMASSLELPANVKGIISDSAYASVHEAFKENIKDVYGVPSFPIVNIASLYVKITEGWSFKQASALEQVKDSDMPILFIHGGEDETVPVSQSNDMYEACTSKGSKHALISDAEHCKTLETKTERYWQKVDSFILDNIENNT